MPSRVFEIAFLVVVTMFVGLLVLVTGIMNTNLPEEQIQLQEFRAKQLILALDTLPASNTSVPPETSVLDLLRMYYISGNPQYLNSARNDIYSYVREMLPDSAWEVTTSDGQLTVRSPLFERRRVCGSAVINIFGNTNITATVCSL